MRPEANKGFDYEIAETVMMRVQHLELDAERDFIVAREIEAIAYDIAALFNTLSDRFGDDYAEHIGNLVVLIGTGLSSNMVGTGEK